ncbi:MAG: MtrB/PioB family decaheme-associated outer membrane protein [Deltaproteobacteria bacterium]|nr:MtrB/PioB family decaheme-associated outer membrane protein [Deltaproteobacteria bacterium]
MRREIRVRAMRCFATTLLTAFAIGLFASAGWAEEDMRYHDLTTYENTLELGTFYSSDDDFKFSDYTGVGQGFEADGWSILGNVDLRRRSAFDAERAYYYRVRGLNLGLDSRFIDAEYQRPGLFGISLFYDEMPKYQTDTATTFMRNAGDGFLTLPSDWVGNGPALPSDSINDIDSFLRGYEIDHKRRTAGGEISLILPNHFDFDASYQHHKLTSTFIGQSWSGAGSQIVPEPLKYNTHQIDSHLRYTADDFQLQLEYYASGFYNDLNGLAWQDPRYTGTSGVGFDDGGVGQKASMPDNWFHQVTASGGLNLPGNSRVMLNAAFGWGTQDDDFLPYTNNQMLNLDPALRLPRPDLNGKLETRLVTARFVSNPLPKLGINVAYRWNERDNDSPIDTYFRVLADSENQNTGNARVNRPYSFEQHKVNADVSYRVYKRTKLTLLYEWDQMTRNLQEVHENNEHTVGGKLVSRPNQYVNLGARYERSYRDRSSYDCVKPLLAGLPPLTLTNPGCPTAAEFPAPQFQNQPQLRKYNMANRRRHDTHTWMTITPTGRLSIGAHLKYIDDDYYKSSYGVTEYRLLSTGLDLSYPITDALNFHSFYNHDKTRREMDATSSRSFDQNANWSSKDKDTTNTVGVGFDFDVLPERLALGVEYLFAKSKGRVDTVTDALGPISPPFPDNETTLHNVSIQGNLEITRGLSLRVGYLFEDFDSSDWAINSMCPSCLTGNNNVVASGERPPHYSAHLVSMSLIYRFW